MGKGSDSLRGKMPFRGRSIISIRDFSREEILHILDTAERIKKGGGRFKGILKDKILATLFFEPSTRTRLSFEAAMTRLGGRVIGFSDAHVSSVSKGESVADTIRIISKYADVIVMRHPLEGAARLASEVADVPVINGGDGANQHPTQTFLDLYTIREAQGMLNGLSIGFLGDLKYGRTVHSLVRAMAMFKAKMYFVSPPGLELPDDIIGELEEEKISFKVIDSLSGVLPGLDVIYATRIQAERFPDPMDYKRVKGAYRLTKKSLKGAKESLKILHPLPRVDELSPLIDKTPYAYYFQQAANGVPVRQALLSLVMGVVE